MKTITTITIDVELLTFIKKNNINLSGFVNDALKTISKEDIKQLETFTDITELDQKIADLSSKTSLLMEQKKTLEKEFKKEQEKKLDEESKWRIL